MSLRSRSTEWDDGIVKTYLTATSQQKDDPEKFYKTHLDIDEVYAEFLPGYQDEFVTQEQFRDEILHAKTNEDIRTFIVRGETGSGKSQLCQWLDYELQGIGDTPEKEVEDRIPLHIKANETSLDQIISTLAEPLGIDPEVDQISALDPEKVADAIVTNLEANPGQALADVDLERIIREGQLESLLAKNVEKYQKGLEAEDETEFDPNLISKEDYRKIALKLGTESVFHQNQETLRQSLRDEIHRHFSHLVGVDDFQSQLREYTQQYKDELGKRPVIICEDVTTFSVLKEQLLDQIIQVESATYDIVLGYTTGFEQDDLSDALGHRGSEDALTYLKDRAEGYLSLSKDGVVHFLDDSLSIDLVKTYLDVIKDESGGVGANDIEPAFDEIYPFNRAFIRLVYGRLLEDGSPRRTPRVLLQKVVRRVLLADDTPYEVVDKNPNVEDLVTPIDPGKYSNELQKLVAWYGYIDNRSDVEASEQILVNAEILDSFGFDRDAGEGVVIAEGSEYVVFQRNTTATRILGDSSDGRPSIPANEDGRGDRPVPNDGGDIKTLVPDPPDQITDPDGDDDDDTSRRESQMNEFLEWIETGDKYESANVLRSGAESVLNMWYDSTKLANPNSSLQYPTGIYYTRGQNVPVSVQGADERDWLSVMLPFGKEHLDLYIQFLEHGIEDGESLPEDANVEQLRAWATDSTVDLRTQIREAVEESLPPGLTIEHCVLLGKFLLANAELGDDDLDSETVFARPLPEQRDYDAPYKKAFGKGSGFTEALESLQFRRQDINDLIEGFYLLKENLVDHDRLNPVRNDISDDPEAFVRLAQQIDTEKLEYPSAFNIGTTRSNATGQTGTGLVAFLDAISDFAVELSLVTDDELEKYFEENTKPVQKWHNPDHTRDDLATLLDRLLDCLGVFNEREKEQWSKTKRKLESGGTLGLDAVGPRLDEFSEPDTDSPVERMNLLHEYEQSREDHLIWEVYRTFDEVIEKLDIEEYKIDDTDDLEERVKALDAVSEYESLRDRVIEASTHNNGN